MTFSYIIHSPRYRPPISMHTFRFNFFTMAWNRHSYTPLAIDNIISRAVAPLRGVYVTLPVGIFRIFRLTALDARDSSMPNKEHTSVKSYAFLQIGGDWPSSGPESKKILPQRIIPAKTLSDLSNYYLVIMYN